ncbi:hypothetical protein CEXT_521671 [Caerostris extrusa]|uniref:Uncharacterized protein n=1 Tax=Caerostris extrusa TaxID=172846 RepID=A0AAV4ST57_CAEEX|nr:hypothetical protein CEXT_521671 [Caerostris extrusa]
MGLQMNCAPIISNFDIPFVQIIARCPLFHFTQFDSSRNTNIGEKVAIRVSRGYTNDSNGPSPGPLMAPLSEQLSISRPPHIGC